MLAMGGNILELLRMLIIGKAVSAANGSSLRCTNSCDFQRVKYFFAAPFINDVCGETKT